MIDRDTDLKTIFPRKIIALASQRFERGSKPTYGSKDMNFRSFGENQNFCHDSCGFRVFSLKNRPIQLFSSKQTHTHTHQTYRSELEPLNAISTTFDFDPNLKTLISPNCKNLQNQPKSIKQDYLTTA